MLSVLQNICFCVLQYIYKQYKFEKRFFMTAYIHIGLEKTGTTTIQNFLENNREKLLQCDFLFPSDLSSRIQVLGYFKPKIDDPYSLYHQITTQESLLNFQEQLKADIKSIIKNNKNKNIIFSHELIQSRLTDKKEIQYFKLNLKKLGFKKIKIILYIRNQSDLFASMCSQSLKNGLQDDESFLYAPGNQYISFVCNHKQTLQWWSAVFGKNNLEVRIFDKQDFVNNDLICDFLSILGLQAEDFVITEEKNLSLSVFGAELCRVINRDFPWFINEKFNEQRLIIALLLGRHYSYCKGNMEDEKFMPKKEVYLSYYDYYKNDNESVRSEYFPHKQTLFNEIDISKYKENYELPQSYQNIINKVALSIIDLAKRIHKPQQPTHAISHNEKKTKKKRLKRFVKRLFFLIMCLIVIAYFFDVIDLKYIDFKF